MQGDQSGALIIPFDEAGFSETTRFETRHEAGRVLWTRSGDASPVPDLVAATYRLLRMLDESQVGDEDRDRRQVFKTDALPPARKAIDAVAVVEHHAAFLLDELRKRGLARDDEAIAKWPSGRRFALAITHDTDAVHTGAPAELVTNLAKFALRRDRRHLELVKIGLKHLRRPAENPHFGFTRWTEILEGAGGLRSAFYLFANVNRTKRDLNDPKSSVVNVAIPWDALSRMCDEGWEFGFHAPIHAQKNADCFTLGKRWLEERLGSPLFGLRHHYWALDWRKPHLTFRKHVNAGFRYDTSIAWQDREGFRAATCHPYQPFDPVYDRALDIYELPTCLMDQHVSNLPDAVERGRQIVQTVAEQGGAAVLDWHTESACNIAVHTGFADLLSAILQPFLEAGDAWFATPWEIVAHWHERNKLLLQEDSP